MLSSIYGSLSLKQIDKAQCTSILIRFIFGFEGAKEFQRGCSPVKVSLQ